MLGNGEEKVEGFIISAEKIFEKVIAQLELRKENITKRLVQNDNDDVVERSKLRGELDGINYSLQTIISNK